jgi:hypothetical protein
MAIFSQEASTGPRLSNKSKLALGVIGVSTVFASAGASVDYFNKAATNHTDRAADVRTANQYQRCATFAQSYLSAHGSSVARLNTLTARQQADCGYSFSAETEAAEQAAQTEILPGAAVLSVNANSTTVRLPNSEVLQHQAGGLISKSQELSPADGIEGLATGAELGLVVEGLLAGVIGWGCAVGAGPDMTRETVQKGMEWVRAS